VVEAQEENRLARLPGNLIGPGFRPVRMRIIAVIGCLLALCACSAEPKACTLIGASAGIGVDVDLPAVAAATLEVCWDGTCAKPAVSLYPATTNGPQTCTGTGPNDTCGVSAVPTGGQHGFADIPTLPKKTVTATLVLTDAAGAVLLDKTLTVTPKATYPNGEGCGEGGAQAGIEVSPAGVVTEHT
jgi:hypothetical protein